MYNGNVGGVGGNDNIKWNKQLAKELDAADGKQDGKISASVWNGFIQKTGSKGNSIKNFINLENAAKSFEYYDSKKDAGKIDWKNKWQGMLFEYQKDLGIIVHNEPSAKETTETKTENEKLLNLSRDLTKEVIELKVEIIRLTREKERLLGELKENPVAELIRMTKGLDIF